MSYQRDVQAFNDRAASYEAGRLGQLHRDFADRAIRVALAVAPAPARALDVGSGTGYAPRQLAAALPDATALITGVGLRSPRWTRLAGPIAATVTAVKG